MPSTAIATTGKPTAAGSNAGLAKTACTVAQVMTVDSAKDTTAAVMGLAKDPVSTDCGTCVMQCGDTADTTTCALGCTSKPLAKGPCSGKQILDIFEAKDATSAVMGLMASAVSAAKDCGMCMMGCASAPDKTACAMGCTKAKTAATTAKAAGRR
jgi:hypothetical protein